MTSMFWGLKLEPGKRYSTTVDKSFHISMATLDPSSVNNEKEVVSVALEEGGQGSVFLLTNLRSKDALSSQLDLNFMTGDRITLFCKGQGVVHLSGYMVLDDDDELSTTMMDDEAEEEEEEDDEEVEEETEDTFLSKSIKALQNAKGKNTATVPNQKRKLEVETNNKAKKKKIELTPAVKEDDSEEESGDGDTDELNDLMADEEDSDAEEEEDEDDLGEDDDDDDEDDDEEVEKEEVVKLSKKQKKQQQQQQQQQQKQKNKTPNNEQQQPGKKQQKQLHSPKTPNGVASPNQKQPQPQSGKKEEKKKPVTPVNTVKEQQNQKTLESNLTSGVKVKEVKAGNGPVCKNGKLAVVYYTGRLKNNGKVFDSVMQGSGFKFRVGAGEVIKGWDIGVAGMKVGGKRIITCPPQVAYGVKGAPPQIPPNSTLVFEVELKGVN